MSIHSIEALLDDHVRPTVDGLGRAARDEDRDALSAYGYELVVLAGIILGEARPQPDADADAVVVPLRAGP